MLLAGIDEAGVGPVLGPLVVTAGAFSIPDELSRVSLWELLKPAVSRRPSRRRGAVAFGDSKKLYCRSSSAGLAHLERGVLAMLATRGRRPRSLRDLLSVLAPGCLKEMGKYPWYAGADLTLPLTVTATDVAFAGNTLSAAMGTAGVELAAMRSEPVFVGEFNRIVRATGNKSTAVTDVTYRLLDYLWRKTDGPSRVHVDRQGGRKHYLPALQRVFPGCDFKILDESDTFSAYVVWEGSRRMEVQFSVDAEDAHLPVALASMASKYVRELFLALLNRFWQGHVKDLAPTAGYYVDGRRFYSQIGPAMRQLGVDPDILYRCK